MSTINPERSIERYVHTYIRKATVLWLPGLHDSRRKNNNLQMKQKQGACRSIHNSIQKMKKSRQATNRYTRQVVYHLSEVKWCDESGQWINTMSSARSGNRKSSGILVQMALTWCYVTQGRRPQCQSCSKLRRQGKEVCGDIISLTDRFVFSHFLSIEKHDVLKRRIRTIYTSTFRLSVANLFPFHAAAKAYQYSKAIFKKRDQNINLLRQNIEPSFSEAKLGRKSVSRKFIFKLVKGIFRQKKTFGKYIKIFIHVTNSL